MNIASAVTARTVIEPGTYVVISEGVLCGVRGTVLGFDNGRVLLSIGLLEGLVITSVDIDWVSDEFTTIPPLVQH
jgi:hypothetical protein